MTDRLQDIFDAHDVNCTINRSGSMFSAIFYRARVFDYESVLSCDTAKYARFFRVLLQAGIYFPPSQFEVCFVSGAHSLDDLDKTAEAVNLALNTILKSDCLLNPEKFFRLILKSRKSEFNIEDIPLAWLIYSGRGSPNPLTLAVTLP